MTVPRLLIAGAHSGVGKSSLTLALVAALRARGLEVQTFKVGPDYLDPGHLRAVSGRECYNLDGWMCSRDYCRAMFASACAAGERRADIAIIEGVMGLFDGGSATTLDGSSAEIATWLDAPVALVVNSHGMARSVAALVHGYATFESRVNIAAVIANFCGSASHIELLRSALEQAQLPPLAGAVPRGALPQLPSRHLGLVSAAEQQWDDTSRRAFATAATTHLNVELLCRLATAAPPLPATATPPPQPGTPVRLAVARDAAFQFYYPDLFLELEQRSVELCFFSPLRDSHLPQNCAGLYLGGGYPEVYAAELATNRAMLEQVREFCAGNRPVYAECGGLLYLCRGIDCDGGAHEFTGVLPCRAQLLTKRQALGYVEVTLEHATIFGAAGDTLRGHEFHYSRLSDDPAGRDGWRHAYRVRHNRSGTICAEGYQRGNILASYVHLHLASRPQALDMFVAALRHAEPAGFAKVPCDAAERRETPQRWVSPTV